MPWIAMQLHRTTKRYRRIRPLQVESPPPMAFPDAPRPAWCSNSETTYIPFNVLLQPLLHKDWHIATIVEMAAAPPPRAEGALF